MALRPVTAADLPHVMSELRRCGESLEAARGALRLADALFVRLSAPDYNGGGGASWFDAMAADIHPDEINAAVDAVRDALAAPECRQSRATAGGSVAWTRDDLAVRDLLLLADGSDISLDVVASWSDAQAQEAERWAARYHLRANDNSRVRVPPRPSWLPAAAKATP